MTILRDLIRLDLTVAEKLGAQKGYTLSGWSFKLELEGKLSGKVFRPLIDFWFGQLHCQTAYAWESQGKSEL